MNSKEPAMEWAADLKGPQSNDEWPQPWPQPDWFNWNQWYQGYYPNNAWSQPANSEWSQPNWPQPMWVGWNQWGNHQWSRPYDEVMPTTCTNDKSSAAAASFNTDKTSAAAVSWPGPWEEKADSATGTTPADLLQSKEQDQYWGDREFLEKNEQRDPIQKTKTPIPHQSAGTPLASSRTCGDGRGRLQCDSVSQET